MFCYSRVSLYLLPPRLSIALKTSRNLTILLTKLTYAIFKLNSAPKAYFFVTIWPSFVSLTE
mgnify:CR=1 FL=1